MSKYKPLWKAVRMHTEESFVLTYAEIERILGFPIVSDLQKRAAHLRL